MVKFKKPPKKPDWYVAWWNGKNLNIGNNLNDERNIYYWDGSKWYSFEGYTSLFMDHKYKYDRWSYLPKDHPMRGKPAPQKQ